MSAPASEGPARPADGPEARLLDQVRPPDWVNPEPAGRYDLVVVGAGTGGLVSASIAASLGARVALVERERMGGDCLNFGCVPSKGLLRAARSWAEARSSARRFGGPVARGDGDLGAAMDRMRRIRAGISVTDGAPRFATLGVDVFFGEARFGDKSSLLVDGAVTLRFRKAILATGTRPAVPPIPGLERIDYLTNETVFDLDERPGALAVLGAGPVGCELAQAFARFGSQVTLVDREDRILPREDHEAAALVQSALTEDGVRFLGGVEVTRVEGRGRRSEIHWRMGGAEGRWTADVLLVATGRVPNVDLGLEAAGITFDQRGVIVDDRLRTSNRRVYAVGDVASPNKFTHAADAQARLAIRNALFFGRGRASDLLIPRVTYTSPELAHVGVSSAEIESRRMRADTYRVALQDLDRARLDGETNGFMAIHVRKGGDEILGATIVSEHAGELISQVTQAMKLGAGLDAIGDVIFPYPTTAEGLRKAADARRRDKLTSPVRRAFDLYFRILRRLG